MGALALLSGLAALILTALPAPAEAHRRPAASVSHCGFGHGAAHSSMMPGGGGDTLEIGDPEDIFHHVYDSASPVSAREHDRIIFTDIKPGELELKRVGDDLVICHAGRRYELLLERHYCRGEYLSPFDTPNNEIEVITFAGAGEIWVTDLLLAALQGEPERPLQGIGDLHTTVPLPPAGWTVRSFSTTLPDWDRPTATCGGG